MPDSTPISLESNGGGLNVLGPDLKETEAGNYFVSNYPPFSQWLPERRVEASERLAQPPVPNTPLGLYVHIPFCRKRCRFCYFKVYTDKNADDIQTYLDSVVRESAALAEQQFVAGRPLDFIYFGGGTPSYPSEKHLAALMTGLQQALPWDQAREVAFECEPGTLSEQKLRAISDFGVTRLSLGLEHFDDQILELNNRAHRSAEIHRAYDWARKVGFQQINIDLIAGMVGETEEKWQDAVERALALDPDALTVYQMELPFNTTIVKEMREQGLDVSPIADWPTKRRWVAEAFERFEAAGYSVSSAYTVVKDPAKMKFIYRDALWFGADMIATGVSSFGILDGVHYQNEANIERYVEAVSRGDSPIFRAMTMSKEERLIRCFILQLKLGRISRSWFLDRFGEDVFARWNDILTSYEKSGMLTRDDEELRLTRQGLLQVDRLLHAFFLPVHQEVRYA